MVGTLTEERMFSHVAFFTLMRLAAISVLPEANARELTRPNRVEYGTPRFSMNYSYAVAYNRTVLDTKWNDPRNAPIPAALKAQSEQIWSRLKGNGFRMATLLQIDALNRNQFNATEFATLKAGLENGVNPSNGQPRPGTINAIHKHFARYHASALAADEALLLDLQSKLGTSAAQW
jgi:hypothetical protein